MKELWAGNSETGVNITGVAKSTLDFTGSGLDDMSVGGGCTISTPWPQKYYRVRIHSTGTPDTFEWSDDDGATWDDNSGAGYNITGAAQTLQDGVQVTFAATTGHTANDYWRWRVGLEDLKIDDDARYIDIGSGEYSIYLWISLRNLDTTNEHPVEIYPYLAKSDLSSINYYKKQSYTIPAGIDQPILDFGSINLDRPVVADDNLYIAIWSDNSADINVTAECKIKKINAIDSYGRVDVGYINEVALASPDATYGYIKVNVKMWKDDVDAVDLSSTPLPRVSVVDNDGEELMDTDDFKQSVLDALDNAIPAEPTNNSVNDRLKDLHELLTDDVVAIILKAARARVNKSTQDLSTGVITIRNDGDSGDLYTETVTDNGDGTYTYEIADA